MPHSICNISDPKISGSVRFFCTVRYGAQKRCNSKRKKQPRNNSEIEGKGKV
jgi:hypothetical protein